MDINDAVLDFADSLELINFGLIAQLIFLTFAILWGFVVLWVWSDASERTTNVVFKLLVALFILPFNVPGLIIYFLIRPPLTIEEVYWSELERKYLIYETAELGDCPKCDEPLMPGYNSCPHCGFVLKNKCVGCGVMVSRDHKFCPFCGEQNRIRAAVKDELTTASMEQSIEDQKADVIEAVQSGEIRYTNKFGLVDKVGSKVVRFFKELTKGSGKKNSKKSDKSAEQAAITDKNGKAVVVGNNSNNKNKKKSKKNRK